MDQQASEHGEEEKSQAMSSKLPSPRREVARLQSDSHGGPDYAELAALGMGPEDVLDFSASTNAFGPPPGVAGALASCDLSRYPDRHAEPLRGALAGYEGVAAEQVLPANGAAQLIWSIAMAYLSPGDTAAVLGPTFGEYRVPACWT
jgi:histidinol-phosphate/aromatic aminotransferase/cobyric acid decarboxylase-like protein